jgi:uncharacterized membrane protein YfcA
VLVTLVLAAGGVLAGTFGALLGLGGGILIVPLLTLGFGLPVREAVGVSLVSVIVTSSAAAGVYLQQRVANLRLGMVLELFTATGALVGGLIAFLLPDALLAGLFAALLVYTAALMVRRSPAPSRSADAEPGALDEALAVPRPGQVPGAVPARSDPHPSAEGRPLLETLSGPDYRVHSLPAGVVGSLGAGLVSALLGVGGGIVKVPLMHLVMGVPLRVATATSNLMIGVTAAASAVIYLLRGGIDPLVAGPTALGVFVGASIGSRTAGRIDVRLLRLLFVVVLLYTAVQMTRRALGMA